MNTRKINPPFKSIPQYALYILEEPSKQTNVLDAIIILLFISQKKKLNHREVKKTFTKSHSSGAA